MPNHTIIINHLIFRHSVFIYFFFFKSSEKKRETKNSNFFRLQVTITYAVMSTDICHIDISLSPTELSDHVQKGMQIYTVVYKAD